MRSRLKPQRITLADGKTIDLKLPQGLEDGTKIRLAGKGEEGRAAAATRSSRSRSSRIASYTREGNNIRLDLPVTLKEAVLGAKVKVPTPEGPVMLTVPKGTTSGKVLRLKGRGFTAKDGKRGDQLVTVEIDVPVRRSGAAAVRRELERRRQPAGEPWCLATAL